jgi:hypothetical protein
VRRIQQQRRETGQVMPKTAAPRKPVWHAWADWLVAKIAACPDIYLRELQAELKRERGEEVCLGTIWAAAMRGSWATSRLCALISRPTSGNMPTTASICVE